MKSLLCGVLFVSSALFVSCKDSDAENLFEEEIEPSVSEIVTEGTKVFIQNKYVKLGIDLNAGGSIFYFSEISRPRNLLNCHDKGRLIQQSYYGINDGSDWHGKPWCWNPIQGGGSKGQVVPTIITKDFSSEKIFVQSHPVHWASGEELNDVIFGETISLIGNVAHIHFNYEYSGDVIHPKKNQELPAVYVDAALPNLCFYSGSRPWTGDKLMSVVPGWPNERRSTTEQWAAYIDAKQWGIGVYTPGTYEMTTYRHKGDGKVGPMGGACSYFAPIRTFAIQPNSRFEYDVYLTIGNVNDIRKRFNKIRISK